jgi:hypothetical protein
MSVFHPHAVACACGEVLTVQLADSINAARSPRIRERILRGELHRTPCPACGRVATVERAFHYIDPSRGALFAVFPRNERHRWRAGSAVVERASGLVPDALTPGGPRTLRVVYGMDELREKLVAQDAGLDDRMVELMKVLLVYEHPVLLRRARLRLTLLAITERDAVFVAAYEHAPQRFEARLPLALLRELDAGGPQAGTPGAAEVGVPGTGHETTLGTMGENGGEKVGETASGAQAPQRPAVAAAAAVPAAPAAAPSWRHWAQRAWRGVGGAPRGMPAPPSTRRRRTRITATPQPDAADDAGSPPDHWVNLWRWSPQPDALAQLQACAAALRTGQAVDLAAPALRKMLGALPRGTQLPGWAKQDLRTLFEYVKAQGNQPLQDALFEVRFGVALDDDWSTNADLEDIDTLWSLLKDLPATHVEGNTKLHEIQTDAAATGSFYQPQSHDILIASRDTAPRERFEDVVRHEVGHAVHEMHDVLVNGWLDSRFGWRVHAVDDDAAVDAWVEAMGGWGTLTAAQRRDVRAALRTATGPGERWSPGPRPTLPEGHPWWGARFGPRLAFEKSGANWYRQHRSWHRHGGKAFFINFWYQTLVEVSAATLDLVARMPDDYAAMSHYEFFAELYALFYDLDDPKRKIIPQHVQDWLAANIGAAQAGMPMRPAMERPRKRHETVRRPKK